MIIQVLKKFTYTENFIHISKLDNYDYFCTI